MEDEFSADNPPAVAVAAAAVESCMLQEFCSSPVDAEQSSRQRPIAKKKKTSGPGRFPAGTGSEYRKHALFRRDHGLIDAKGGWLLCERLQSLALPPMCARMLDLLHIIWLLFEQRGVSAEGVDQMWFLCQSIHRGSLKRGKKGNLTGQWPNTPGLHLRRPQTRPLAPCVLPRGMLWLNRLRRFATGAELLQLQGVPLHSMHTEFRLWRKERDLVLKSVAGNGFAVPVMAWYVLLAVACITRKAAAQDHGGCHSCRGPLTPGSTVAVTAAASTKLTALTEFSFARFADELVQLLLDAWPDCFSGLPRVIVKMGTLCSGGDFIVPMTGALLAAIGRRPGLPTITLQDEFACEIDESVRELRKRALQATGHYYRDCHTMPVEHMASVDLLVFGSSCKSLSSQNINRGKDRRGLMHTDPP